MNSINLSLIKQTRNNLLEAIQDFSVAELNFIPPGFNNNIAWNLGHILVTQQLLCYKLSGNKLPLNDSIVNEFKKGTTPKSNYSSEMLDVIKLKLITLTEALENDISKAIFQNYATYPTSYNFTLKSFEEALAFNSVHEALHFGYIMALKRVVRD